MYIWREECQKASPDGSRRSDICHNVPEGHKSYRRRYAVSEEFAFDQEFAIVELEPRRAAAPEEQTNIILIGTGGSGGMGSGGSGGSGGMGSGGSGT